MIIQMIIALCLQRASLGHPARGLQGHGPRQRGRDLHDRPLHGLCPLSDDGGDTQDHHTIASSRHEQRGSDTSHHQRHPADRGMLYRQHLGGDNPHSDPPAGRQKLWG